MDKRLILFIVLMLAGQTSFAASTADINQDIRITKQILAVQSKDLGQNHILTADLFHHLATLYESKKEIEAALPYYENALTIYYAQLGVEDPKVRDLIDHLSSLYSQQTHNSLYTPIQLSSINDIDADIAILDHIYTQQQRSLGQSHELLLPLLTEQARLHYHKQDYAKAGDLYGILLRIQKEILPENHPSTAETLQVLGELAHKQKDLLTAVNSYARALRIWQTALPNYYQKISFCLNKLGFLHHEIKDVTAATHMAREALEVEHRLLSNILSFSSEQQRLRYVSTYEPYSLPGTVGDTVTIARSVLLHKGLVLDSIIEDLRVAEASDDERHQRLILKRNLSKDRLMQLELSDPQEYDNQAERRRQQVIQNLQREIRQTEQQLGYSRSELGGTKDSLNLQPADIQRLLDEKTALIEFVRYPHYLGKQKFEDYYGAVVFTAQEGLHWIKLGRAKDIDAHIRRYQRLVRNKNTRDSDLRYNLQRLYRQLWLTIDKSLHWKVERIIISPTHRINFVSFATLLTPRGEFLNDHYSFSYVTSGRDLMRKPKTIENKTAAIFANPSFGNSNKSNPLFAALPGTLEEANSIKQLAEFNQYTVDVYVAEDAKEENIKEINTPGILHIATHGFFAGQPHWRHTALGSSVPILRDERQAQIRTPSGWTSGNPMRQSGLALAHAESTIHQWRQGLSEPVHNDGLLTAEEVSLLDLRQTWLVVLSACDTGLGDAQSGEGVFGLRRGFLQAGASNLIMTLWNIPDSEVTPYLIQNIYGGIFRGESPTQSLASTQKEWMHTLRESQGLHAAVKKAGAFIIVTQGPAYVELTTK